jgi:hypothetical protein
MSDKPIPTPPGQVLDLEQVKAVSGGDGACTIVDAAIAGIQNLTTAYESLVSFTSHVIERVVTSSTNLTE